MKWLQHLVEIMKDKIVKEEDALIGILTVLRRLYVYVAASPGFTPGDAATIRF